MFLRNNDYFNIVADSTSEAGTKDYGCKLDKF